MRAALRWRESAMFFKTWVGLWSRFVTVHLCAGFAQVEKSPHQDQLHGHLPPGSGLHDRMAHPLRQTSVFLTFVVGCSRWSETRLPDPHVRDGAYGVDSSGGDFPCGACRYPQGGIPNHQQSPRAKRALAYGSSLLCCSLVRLIFRHARDGLRPRSTEDLHSSPNAYYKWLPQVIAGT